MGNINHEEVRARRRKAKNRKTVALVLATLLLVGAIASGTLAWLTARTNEVTNVFTTSDIDITLQEHEYDPDTDKLTDKVTYKGVDNYKMVPGWTIPKDPWVTVKGGSEDCWVFIKVEEKGGNVAITDGELPTPMMCTFDNFIDYKIDETKWTQLLDKDKNPVAGIYVSSSPVAKITEDCEIKILAGGEYVFNGVTYTWKSDQVLTKPDVTKEMMNAVTDDTKPTLTFTAYASQYWKSNTENFTAYEAWKNVSGN